MQKRAVQADVIPDALWPHVSAVVASHTGLHFPQERRGDLERGLAYAASELGFEDARSCAHWLLSSEPTKPQLDTLASHLTIGETYFFRERKAFEALATQVLPALIEKRRGHEQRLRLWSAACSTGEEAYSLAILVRQVLPDWQNWRVSILGTDINGRSLRKATQGVYGDWSFRDAPPGFRERYFEPTADGRYSVLPEVRRGVRFAQMNLAQDGFPSLATDTNAMDVVFCRNVLIYFEPSLAATLIGKLRRSLMEDGWLVVSPSECSQALFAEFAAVNFPGAVLYRKSPAESKAAASVAPSAIHPAPAGATAAGSFNPRAVTTLAPRTVLKSDDFARLTRSRANEGRLDEALDWSERWIVADKLDAVAHYLNAMVLQELGDREQARRSLQRAIYLKPDFALAHFALGNLVERRGPSNRPFENALELLGRRPATETVPESDGLTAGRLSEIITALLPAREAANDRSGR
jgi:chemotaxis protein methyltransferase CheR